MDGISALMDGELGEAETRGQLARVKSDDEARYRWDEFHLIGDSLRGEPMLSAQFSQRLAKRLADEPTVLAPRRIIPKPARVTTYALSAAASVSAAALVAWVALSSSSPTAPGEVATGPSRTPSPIEAGVTQPVAAVLNSIPNDGSVNDFLLVHHGISPSSSLQGVASYIRTVSTRQADGR